VSQLLVNKGELGRKAERSAISLRPKIKSKKWVTKGKGKDMKIEIKWIRFALEIMGDEVNKHGLFLRISPKSLRENIVRRIYNVFCITRKYLI
jgi:hypothetical protein